MDLLSKRYANPCFFLDGMIQTGRFSEFVESFVTAYRKEEEERVTWEFYLHKVFEGSFGEFVAEMNTNRQNQEMSARTVETTVNESLSILKKFTPGKDGEK